MQKGLRSRRVAASVITNTISSNLKPLAAAAVLSGAINVLALTGSVYMLKVYNLVLPSRSLEMLAVLTAAMAGLYVLNGFADFYRLRVLSRTGARIGADLTERVLPAAQDLAVSNPRQHDALQPLRDLDHVRTFLSGLGLVALFDLPWLPVYVGVIFYLHPLLGAFAAGSVAILICLAVMAEWGCARPTKAVRDRASQEWSAGTAILQHAQTTRAMGFQSRMLTRWSALHGAHRNDRLWASDRANIASSASRAIRPALQSGILGLGAYLVVTSEASIGVMIAVSILLSRALAPLEWAIGSWRSFAMARQSLQRLNPMLQAPRHPPDRQPVLPAPHRTLSIENLSLTYPGASLAAVQDVSFALEAGDGLAIIGPSASGKSTLVRAIAGALSDPNISRRVHLDGIEVGHWTHDHLGRHVGYVDQTIGLFDGTIADNISRFDPNATVKDTVRAANSAHAHEMILRLPEGYQTRIGEGGMIISAGQRQRIALARALYGEPFLLVLDEPDANLDRRGSDALKNAITSLRQRGGIAIVVAQRGGALSALSHVLALANGRVCAFGLKDQVLPRVLRPAGHPFRHARAGTAVPTRTPKPFHRLGSIG